MKVIQPGQNGPEWSKQFSCTGAGNGEGGCSAVLLVAKSDLYHTHHYDYGGGHDIYTTFCCPLCGAETDVKVPPQIERGLPDKSVWLTQHHNHRSSS